MQLNITSTALSIVAVFSATPAFSQVMTESVKLLPADGAESDAFASAVAISSSYVVAGAPLDNNGIFSNSGSAYVFDAGTGVSLVKLVASDGTAGERFGWDVGTVGNMIVVGAPRDDASGLNSGSVYVFSASSGLELAKLKPADGAAHDEFGRAIAAEGSTLIVGAPFDDDNGAGSGSAYLFDLTSGLETAKLVPADGQSNDEFGSAVAIHGGTALVGAFDDDDNGASSGSAYLFDASSGALLTKLTASDGVTNDRFGTAVSISGNTALVGAPWRSDNGQQSGAAYLYDVGTGAELAKMLPADGVAGDRFGTSVSISGNYAAVGSLHIPSNTGKVYFFDLGTGEEITRLHSSDVQGGDHYGEFVAFQAMQVVVGAPSHDDAGIDSGAAYIFSLDCNSNGVPDLAEISSGQSADCNLNGLPDDCDVASGSSADLNSNGVPDECDCSTTNYCLAAGNSNGTQALMASSGSTHITDNAFVIHADGVVPLQFGLMFYGTQQQAAFNGEGMLCIASPLYRLAPVVLADDTGHVTYALDLTTPPANIGPGAVSAFSTWNFQLWYRDPLGGPSGFNFSDGLQVTFCP